MRSPHFTLKTDLDDELARYFAARFEAVHSAMELVIAPPRGARTDNLEIVLFDRVEDFRALRSSSAGGMFLWDPRTDLEPERVIVMYRGSGDDVWSTFRHEIAHRMMWQRTPRLPIWVDEGLAQYYSTLEIDGNEITVGKALPEIDFWDRSTIGKVWFGNFQQVQIPVSTAPGMAHLLDADYADFHDDAWQEQIFYTASWKLAHMFKLGPDARYVARFSVFMAEIERGTEPSSAFSAAFDGTSIDDLERAYEAYLTEPVRHVQRFHFESPKEVSTTSRTLTDAEVHLLWARLRPWDDNWWRTIKSDLDAAEVAGGIAAEVHYRRALLFFKQDMLKESAREVHAALAKQPEEPRYVLLGLVVDLLRKVRGVDGGPTAQDEKQLLARLGHFARLATTPLQRSFVAMFQLRFGQPGNALRIIAAAVQDDPTCGACHEVHAEILLLDGRLDEASNALSRARAMTPHQGRVPLKDLDRRIQAARAARGH